MAEASKASENEMNNILENTQALNLPVGTVIIPKSKKEFTIIDTLQKSIHRAVYVSSLQNAEGRFVIKAEPPNDKSYGYRMEKAVAASLQCATPMEVERFAEFVDYGESKVVNFVIWKRLGPSLDELHIMYNQKFSLATATRINVQTLRAISKLHALGYIHRNIQPSHFVVGETAKRVVYLISFSLCRPFKLSAKGFDSKRISPSLRSKMQSPTAEQQQQQQGNDPTTDAAALRDSASSQQYFAARTWYSSDAGTSLSRMDDIESWLYMSLHFVNSETIPWLKTPIQMLSEIYEMKRNFFHHEYSEEIFVKGKAAAPAEYRRFIDEINATQANSTPDYDKLILIATKVSHQACPNPNHFYDWEEIPAPLLTDYGEFRVPAPSPAANPHVVAMYSTKQKKILGTDDPEMDKLVENWQQKFRKLILAGVPRAKAYQKVMGISHPPELSSGHWKPMKPKKKKKKVSAEKLDATQEQS